MSSRTDTAIAYFDAFAANDHARILSLLTDDVVWNIHGHRDLLGKEDFDSEIENGALFRFAACDILTFDGDLLLRVESYVVPLTN